MSAVTIQETQLGRAVVSYLKEMGWEVWQEVKLGANGPIPDIVCKRGPAVGIVEIKKTLSFAVLSQAHKHVQLYRAHQVWVAGPDTSASSWVFDHAAKSLGMGVLRISKDWIRDPDSRWHKPIKQSVAPPWRRSKKWHKDEPSKTLGYCFDSHQTKTEAGAPAGGAWSPFKETCENLLTFVRFNPGATMKEAVDGVEHHYSTSASARSSVAYWIHAGKVPNLSIKKRGGRNHLYPANLKLAISEQLQCLKRQRNRLWGPSPWAYEEPAKIRRSIRQLIALYREEDCKS